MLWLRKAQVFSRFDYGSFVQRCRDHDLDGISGDVRREDQKASPPHFCHYLCLVVRLAIATVPLHVVWEHLASGVSQFTGGCVAMQACRVLTG
jgi:hypothetical protein